MAPVTPRPRRDLSRSELTEKAATILRTEGERALTMRRVAAECGVTPMALYHHVRDKDELVVLAVDHIVGECLPGGLDPSVDWRTAMTDFITAYRSHLVTNPGAGSVYISRPILGPAMAEVTEILFELVARGGMIGTAAAEAVDAIVLVTHGSIANDLSRPANVRRQLLDHLPRSETPRMVDQIDSYADRDPEARFRLALDWLLDGIERSARSRSDPSG